MQLTSDQIILLLSFLIPLVSAALSFKILSVTNKLKTEIEIQIGELKESYHEFQMLTQKSHLNLENEINLVKQSIEFHLKKKDK